MRPTLSALALLLLCASGAAAQSFVNWESPHVHPLDLTPNRETLVAVDTAAGRLEVLDVAGAALERAFTVAVGVEPVSARARTDDEVWVVNLLSDSVSIVDLATRNVVRTIATRDEPCDVVFAGSPQRAFVSCSQANVVQVFTTAGALVAELPLAAEDPRALAVSPDGSKVYAAVFESGNRSTVLGGGLGGSPISFPRNVVNDPAGPWGGVNPPPNSGAAFVPPKNPSNPAPPRVGLIVKKDGAGTWQDDNGGDWTSIVSGAQSALSDRPAGWDVLDHDVAIIDAATLAVTYADGLMNLCMALAVHPTSGQVVVVGTDATNEVRFEPNLAGRFVRVHAARIAAGGAVQAVVDLNPHLSYATASVPQAVRDLALGDPRGIVFRADGTRGWVAGMGSNNLVAIDASGARVAGAPTIEVGEGPTGLAIDDASGRLFVLDRFEGAISVVDLASELETARVSLFDPTPDAVRNGRKHLYDTHAGSGLGQVACASCHVDARMDRLAWDLGDPSGSMKPFAGNCPDGGCQDWHPMKGPMLTQTLQDIVGKEPHHWRGDRDGLEEFAGAFQSLQADDAPLGSAEMAEFEAFLATIHFPPNPFRQFDNSLPVSLPLPGHFTTGRFGPAGAPLPAGNAQNGLAMYRPPRLLDGGLACVTCHTIPTGAGPTRLLPLQTPIPPGPNGEEHLMIVSVDGSTNRSIKVPQLRNLHERVGFELTQSANTAGFGFLHDGSVDSLARFVNEPAFSLQSDQETADMVAFMLAFSGSGLPVGSTSNVLIPLGQSSLDTHAAVGAQVTFASSAATPPADLLRYGEMLALADLGAVGLIAHGVQAGVPRGWAYVGGDTFLSDREGESLTADALRLAAAAGSEVTITVVPPGTELRLGIDRDEDGDLDRDELELVVDPEDPSSTTADNLVSFCFGDGSGAACPCGNESVPGSGAGCANSSGAGARLLASGSATVAAGDLRFDLDGAPPATFAVLFSAQRALPVVQPGFGIPAFDGLRCVGGGLLRHGTRATDGLGQVGASNAGWGPPNGPVGGIAAQGGFVPGQSRFFQAFVRDNLAAGCGTGQVGTNGIRVTFL